MGSNGFLLELPVLPKTDTDDARCSDCAFCCTYVAVEIDEPTCRDSLSNILWYLYHENIRVYLDENGDWFVQFWTRCEALRPDGLCGVYETRPDVCEEYTADDCEITHDDIGEEAGFDTAYEFTEWLRTERPKLYKKLRGKKDRRNIARAPKKQKAKKNEPLKLVDLRKGDKNGAA